MRATVVRSIKFAEPVCGDTQPTKLKGQTFMDLTTNHSKKYTSKTPILVTQIRQLSVLTSDGERVEIDVEEGFLLISESDKNFVYETKVHRGTIKRNC